MALSLQDRSAREDRDLGDGWRREHYLQDSRSNKTSRAGKNEMHGWVVEVVALESSV